MNLSCLLLKPFCPYGWIFQSQILSFWSFESSFSMCFCDKLSTTSTRLSQLIFTQEKSRRLDFNKAFNLVTLYISNIYTIKVFSLERRDKTQKQRLITSRIFSFFALWNLFRKIGNYLFAKNWKKLMAIDHTSFEKNLSSWTPPSFIPQQPAKLNILYVK